MLRTVVSAAGLILLVGCVGRSVDPFATVSARLDILKHNSQSETADTLAAQRGETTGETQVRRDDNRFDSFCLTAYPTLEDVDDDASVSPTSINKPTPFST